MSHTTKMRHMWTRYGYFSWECARNLSKKCRYPQFEQNIEELTRLHTPSTIGSEHTSNGTSHSAGRVQQGGIYGDWRVPDL